ncbi:Methyl-accepting chemotaxis protein (modular protein) [Planktothrix sp. PCC 11201]|uniref:sensor domain-containing diguanylate cyclase n=1 Tax=Planktothrix sp. PCC 11201 TaxID=1729650 RepID=UPI00091B4239|nr:diguanylate cyclase [Planktothrix sp. PCC 11201]SKB12002.1 Methyl-accepting chemotaxis protein (modular protein) [Planktothrix sp. PCC 11201]
MKVITLGQSILVEKSLSLIKTCVGWIIRKINFMQYPDSQNETSDLIESKSNNNKLLNHSFQTQERVRQLLDSSQVVIFSCQPQPKYQITFISNNVKIILGYDAAILLREKDIWHTYVPPSDQDQWQNAFVQLLVKENYIHEAQFLHANGNFCWLRVEMRLIKDEGGNISEILGYFVDITDRKAAEMQLLTAENRLKTVIETVGSGITLSDKQGNFYIFNSKMTEITGYSLEDAQSHPDFLALLYPSSTSYSQAQNRLNNVALMGSVFNAETTIPTKNGELKTLLLSTVMIEDQENPLFLSTFQNITPLKRAEKALCQMVVQEHLIWEITHKIRQSLNLEDILNTTVTEVQQLLECDRVFIYQIFPNRQGKVIAETNPNKLLKTQPSKTPLIPLNCYEKFNQGRIRVLNKINHDPNDSEMLKMIKYWEIDSAIIVPLLEMNQLWGLLIVDQNQGLRHWLKWEANLLRQISEQVGIAIQQSHLYQETQDQAHRAQILNQVIQVIRQSLDLDTIFSMAITEIVSLLRLDRACILQYLPQQKQWQEVACFSEHHYIIPPVFPQMQQTYCLDSDAFDVLTSEEIQYLTGISGSWLPIPLRVGSKIWGCLGLLKHQNLKGWKESEIELTCAIADQLAIAIQQSELYQELQVANQQLLRLATIDGLTQVANRRRFDQYLEQQWQDLQADKSSLALILCDIDYFKQYNDYYGHLAGDSCLKKVAQALENILRDPVDLVARYGGEEFAIILPNTSWSEAIQQAQHIQNMILQLQLPHADSRVSQWLTLSLGIACTIPSDDISPSVLIGAADQALYQAKQQGRACYCVHGVEAI